MSTFAPLLTALAALCGAFGALYVFARRIDDYGVVDSVWSYAFAALATFYALAGAGWPGRRALIAALACPWSLRSKGAASRRYPQTTSAFLPWFPRQA